jgi:hypothetical protein
MNRIMFFLTIFFIVTACNLQNQKKVETIAADTLKILTPDDILADSPNYEGKIIRVEGMVSHVCKHGGQKMFLVSSDPEKYLRINTGKNIPEFPIDLEGSNIQVTGKVVKLLPETSEQSEAELKEHHENDSANQESLYHANISFVVEADNYVVKD